MSDAPHHPEETISEQLSEAPGWGCLLVLGLAALALLPITYWVWSRPHWDAEQLFSLLMAVLGFTVGAIALYRLGTWLVTRQPRDWAEWSIARGPRTPARAVFLERDRPTGRGVVFFWALALFWNVPVGVVSVGAVSLWAQGQPAVGLLIFEFVFALFGLLILGFAMFALVEEYPGLRGLRSAEVKLSAHPLQPGGHYQVELFQSGRVDLRTLRAVLLCEVHVPHPDGEGGTYDKIETPYQVELVYEEDLRIEVDRPFMARGVVHLPADARPSWAGESNKVRWKVAVSGLRPGWHWAFRFDYPVTVAPQAGT